MFRHTSLQRHKGVFLCDNTKESGFIQIISIAVWFVTLQLFSGGAHTQLGTTPNIKHIVMGRCFTYATIVNPNSRYDCEKIWRHFEEAVVYQSSCNVTVEHYNNMFDVMPQNWPCNRFLFWSKTRALMHSYAGVFRHLWTLEDTLVGYMFNDLIWCGQEEDSDFDFNSCPEWSACRNHPVFSLWRQASQTFAEMACGNITVLLNGSIDNAFNKKSMFGSVELDSLNPERVDYVNIKVVTNLEGPQIESCSKGSILQLIHILHLRGFRWTCTDRDPILIILQCFQKPGDPICRTHEHTVLQQKSLTCN